MTDHEDDALPPWTNDELALLRSAEVDAPSARSLPAALAAAGVGAAVAAASAGAQAAAAAASSQGSAVGVAGAASAGAATSAASGAAAGTSVAAAKWTAGIALGKWIAVVAVGSAAVAGGIVLSERLPGRDRVVPQLNHSASHAAPAPHVSPRVAAPASTEAAVPADQVVVPAAEPEHPPARPTRQSAASTTAAHEPPAQPDIRLEIAALDSARASLRNGHAREALAALDRYDSSFGPDAALQLEASTLRIEALAQTGNHAQAETLARTFLTAHPNSPYATRIRALLMPRGGADERPAIR